MTRREGRNAFELTRGIEEDEGQRMIARLVSRRRRFNLLMLVMIRKGNYPCEA